MSKEPPEGGDPLEDSVLADESPASDGPFRKIPEHAEEEYLESLSSYDQDSVEETKLLNRGLTLDQLEEELDAKDKLRADRFLEVYEWLMISLVIFIAAGLVVLGFVWGFHLVAPTSWRWLPEEDLQVIQYLVLGAGLVGLAGNHIKKRLG